MGNEEPQRQGDGQELVKKAYRRPSVQVYGTLSQVTRSSATPGTHRIDAGFDPNQQPAPNTNRT